MIIKYTVINIIHWNSNSYNWKLYLVFIHIHYINNIQAHPKQPNQTNVYKKTKNKKNNRAFTVHNAR